jgi:hypothetical protein
LCTCRRQYPCVATGRTLRSFNPALSISLGLSTIRAADGQRWRELRRYLMKGVVHGVMQGRALSLVLFLSFRTDRFGPACSLCDHLHSAGFSGARGSAG